MKKKLSKRAKLLKKFKRNIILFQNAKKDLIHHIDNLAKLSEEDKTWVLKRLLKAWNNIPQEATDIRQAFSNLEANPTTTNPEDDDLPF